MHLEGSSKVFAAAGDLTKFLDAITEMTYFGQRADT